MRVLAGLFALGLAGLVWSPPAHANDIDENTRTECRGNVCYGSYCNADGDAVNCWRESTYRRSSPKEEVHWICTQPHHKCNWVKGPAPDNDDWNKFQF